MKILLVDDEVEISDLYVRYLKRCGFADTFVAYTSQAAIEYIQSHKPELAILDISLGSASQGTGLDVLSRIRQILPECRVCMMSAYRDEHEKMALDMGAHRFIAKPFAPDILLELIRSYVKGPA